MYEIIKNVIGSGRYELSDMLNKIDTIWIQGGITDEQRTELIDLAREQADASQSIDVLAKLEELDRRVTVLEKGDQGETDPDEYPVYVVGKWYYKDDKVTYNDERYICTAPDGVVCTWSPDEYPEYWQKVEE